MITNDTSDEATLGDPSSGFKPHWPSDKMPKRNVTGVVRLRIENVALCMPTNVGRVSGIRNLSLCVLDVREEVNGPTNVVWRHGNPFLQEQPAQSVDPGLLTTQVTCHLFVFIAAQDILKAAIKR